MEDQIGTVLHWSNQKEPKQAKIKYDVIRRNLDRIRISAATSLPSNPSRHSQVSLIQKTEEIKNKIKKNPDKKLNNSGCQTMCPIKLKVKTCIPHHYKTTIVKFHVID